MPAARGPAGIALEVAEIREVRDVEVAAEFRHQVARVFGAHLEDGQAIDVREDRGLECSVDSVKFGERLGHQHETRAVLAELAQHLAVVGGAQRARFVDQHHQAAALARRYRDLLLGQEANEVEQRRSDQRGGAFAERADRRVDDEDAASRIAARRSSVDRD